MGIKNVFIFSCLVGLSTRPAFAVTDSDLAAKGNQMVERMERGRAQQSQPACSQEEKRQEEGAARIAIVEETGIVFDIYAPLRERVNALQRIENVAFVRNRCTDTQVKAVVTRLKNVILAIQEYDISVSPDGSQVILAAANSLLDIASHYRSTYEGSGKPYLGAMESVQALVDGFVSYYTQTGHSGEQSLPVLRTIITRLEHISGQETIESLKRQTSWAVTTLIALENAKSEGDADSVQLAYQAVLTITSAARRQAQEEKKLTVL